MTKSIIRPALALVLLSLVACRSTGSGALPTATLEEARIGRAAVEAIIERAESGLYGRIDHFLLMRDGRVVVDRAFARDTDPAWAAGDPVGPQYDYEDPAWHPFWRDTDLHSMQSVTKSITSICVGIAIDDGAIPGGVASPAMQWFDAYAPDMADERRAAMTLEDLLTMRSGIDWDESLPYEDPANTCILLEASDDWIQFVIDRPMREEPGTRFDYNSGASVLLGKIVREATGQRIDEFARERLFEPLGITEFRWKLTPRGEVDTEGGLYLRAEDLARVAQLMLQRGEWRGERIVSAAWVDASTRSVAETPGGGYGYQWWIPDLPPDAPALYHGSGFGGQFPIIVPELGVVAVLTAWNTFGDQPEASVVGDLVTEVLPAVQ